MKIKKETINQKLNDQKVKEVSEALSSGDPCIIIQETEEVKTYTFPFFRDDEPSF